MDKNISMLDVVCISDRKPDYSEPKVGERYMIDRLTIFLDRDGDAFGTVYNLYNKCIGIIKLSRFRCAY